jgi:phosphatidylinositol-3-phosphatase
VRRFALALVVIAAVAVGAGALVAELSEAKAQPAQALPRFDHVVLVVFENHEYDDVIGSRAAPTFNALARRYALLTQSYGVAHPSLPNYLALVSGSTFGIRSDCVACFVGGRSIADTLEARGLTWSAYQEGIPAAGSTVAYAGRYAGRHAPFLYFRSIRSQQARRERVVPYTRFARDLASGRLPTFSLVVPNLCHSMHDCSVATGDAWLKRLVTPLLASPELARSVVIVTFDEGESNVRGGGRIPTLVLGPLVRPGARSSRLVTHYGVLRTIEDGLGLPRLGASASAAPIAGIWRHP